MADHGDAAEKKKQAQFEAEQDVRTLVESDRIKRDKKRLARAMKSAKTQLASLNKVTK